MSTESNSIPGGSGHHSPPPSSGGHAHAQDHGHSQSQGGLEAVIPVSASTAAAAIAHPHDQSHSHDHDHGHTHEQKEQTEFTRRFFLFLEMTVLLLWSVAMVWFYASGRIDKYLVGDGTFRIQVLIAGLALAVLGWFNWSMRALNAGCGHDHSHDNHDHDHSHAGAEGGGCGHNHDHGHGHKHGDGCEHAHGAKTVAAVGSACCGHGEGPSDKDNTGCGHNHDHDHDHGHAHSPGIPHSHEGTVSGRAMGLVLLAFSVTASVALTPDDFSDAYKKNMLTAYASQPAGSQAMPEAIKVKRDTTGGGKGGGLTLEQVEKVQPRNKDGNFEMDVMQLYYSGSDPEYAKVMKGQGVEVIGQIVHDSTNPAPNRWRIFVLQVTCCAADARPYSVPVEFTDPVPDGLKEMAWYKLTGKVDYTVEKNGGASVLRATGAQPALRPRDQRTLF
ncbi:MAG: hypothetical protein JWM59_2743 [Verrucomicrobiales bacterium]|nr:hypothetical protein [Verrucomicrobiales bacterium]